MWFEADETAQTLTQPSKRGGKAARESLAGRDSHDLKVRELCEAHDCELQLNRTQA